jgi:hypothetical protein
VHALGLAERHIKSGAIRSRGSDVRCPADIDLPIAGLVGADRQLPANGARAAVSYSPSKQSSDFCFEIIAFAHLPRVIQTTPEDNSSLQPATRASIDDKLAEEAGLSKPMVKQRMPELAEFIFPKNDFRL